MENQVDEKISIWKNRTYVMLFSSYAISTFGSFFDMLSVMLLFSYFWHSEPWIISLIPVAYALPHALLSQFVGVLVDRNKKIKVMLLADLLTAFLTLPLIFISSQWVMLGIIFVRSSITVVHFPAQQALARQVVHSDFILKAVMLNGTVNQLSKILGPFLGASIAAAFSPRISFIVYATALLVSVCILLLLRDIEETNEAPATLEREKAKRESIWKTLLLGWGIMFRSRVLMVSFSFSLVGFLSIQLVDAQFTVLTRELFPGTPSVLGWLLSMVGLGAVSIIIVLNRFKTIKRYGWFLGGSIFLIGAGILVMGMLSDRTSFWWLFAAAMIIGFGTGLFSVVFNYILQVESPNGRIGQMSGMYNSLTGLILLIAPITGGFLVQLYGVFSIFQVIGTITVMIGLLGIAMQRVLWGEGVGTQKAIENTNKGENHTV